MTNWYVCNLSDCWELILLFKASVRALLLVSLFDSLDWCCLELTTGVIDWRTDDNDLFPESYNVINHNKNNKH